MAYFKDILNVVGDGCLDYKLTVLGGEGIICEGFRSIIKFSNKELILRLYNVIVHIGGENFEIGELASGYIQLLGKVDSITREELGAKYDKK